MEELLVDEQHGVYWSLLEAIHVDGTNTACLNMPVAL